MMDETWQDHMARMLEVNHASGGWDRALIIRNEDGSWVIVSTYRSSDVPPAWPAPQPDAGGEG